MPKQYCHLRLNCIICWVSQNAEKCQLLSKKVVPPNCVSFMDGQVKYRIIMFGKILKCFEISEIILMTMNTCWLIPHCRQMHKLFWLSRNWLAVE